MEIIETQAPLRIWRKELAMDSGGAGQFRGGLGQDVEIELTTDQPAILSLFVERVQHPALGRWAALPGAASRVVWNGRESGFPLKGRSRDRRAVTGWWCAIRAAAASAIRARVTARRCGPIWRRAAFRKPRRGEEYGL